MLDLSIWVPFPMMGKRMWEGTACVAGQEYIFGPASVEGAIRTHSQMLSVLESPRMLVAIQSPGPCP